MCEKHEATTAKERVQEERAELQAKICKLENLLGKVKTNNMPNHDKLLKSMSKEQRKLLAKQLRIMKDYEHILKRRLDLWIDE